MLEQGSKDEKISLVNGGKLVKIEIENEQAAEYLKKFLNAERIGQKKDGRQIEDDYNIELVKNSDNSYINITGNVVTALDDLKGLEYISDEKEKQLRLLLADIIIASRKGNAAKMLFHRKSIHTLNNGPSHANGKTAPALKTNTTISNGPAKKP